MMRENTDLTTWIRLKVELKKDYNPSYTELLSLIKSCERELKGFRQVKRVLLEDYFTLPQEE